MAHKLENFVMAFGAARILIQKANKEGDLLEGLVLYAALADGFLRIGLVLKAQIRTKTLDIDPLLISQEKGGQYYTERQIHRKALAERVIKQDVFDEVSALYDVRNDAVHKFFLTGLRYIDLASVLERYEVMYKNLNQIVYDLECEQLRLGVGMTGIDKAQQDKSSLLRKIMELKIDSNTDHQRQTGSAEVKKP